MRLDLEEYNFDVEYVQGKLNVSADALSRIAINSETLKSINVLAVQTRSMLRKQNETDNNEVTENLDITESDQLKAYEAVDIKEWYNLPKLQCGRVSEDNTNRDENKSYSLQNSHELKCALTNKSGTKELSSTKTNINIASNESLGNFLQKIENMAKRLRISAIALALSSVIFQICSVQLFKKSCNDNLKDLRIILYTPKSV